MTQVTVLPAPPGAEIPLVEVVDGNLIRVHWWPVVCIVVNHDEPDLFRAVPATGLDGFLIDHREFHAYACDDSPESLRASLVAEAAEYATTGEGWPANEALHEYAQRVARFAEAARDAEATLVDPVDWSVSRGAPAEGLSESLERHPAGRGPTSEASRSRSGVTPSGWGRRASGEVGS